MSTKKFLRSLVCVSVTIASLVMSRGGTVSAAGPICTVPGDYSTIQAAVNDSGCTTINVLAGAYTENVTISRPLSLLGSQAGVPVTGRTFGSGAESTVTGGALTGAVAVFKVAAAGVTIDGFSVTNVVTTGAAIGIQATAAGSGLILQNTIINNVSTPDTSANGTAQAIYLESGPDNVQVKGNAVSGVQSNRSAKAVLIGDSSATDPSVSVSIVGNVFQNIVSTTRGAYGVQINNGNGTTANNGLTVTNNTISGLMGGWAHAIGLEASTPNVIVSGNTITNIGAPSADQVAVWVENTNPGFASGHVTGNNVAVGASAFGIALHPALFTGPSLDGTCNWWGAATGPTASTNPGGTGSPVTPNVVYKPWLIAAAPNGACIGGNVPDNKDQCKNNGWKNLVRANGTPFVNQGDCIQYVNTGK